MTDVIDSMGDDWLEAAGVEPEAEPVAEAATPEPEAPADPEPAAEQATEVETDQKQVPLAALKEEREKRQALERRMAELESRAGQQQPQAQQVRQKAPDPYEDPDGYDAHVKATVAETEWRMRAEMSGRFAEGKHGKETVEAALTWAQEQAKVDPTLEYKVRAQASPVEFVIDEYKRSQTLSALGGMTIEEYAAKQGWIVSQTGAPSGASQQKPSSPTPPKSLSQAPGSGGVNQAPKNADWSEIKFALG